MVREEREGHSGGGNGNLVWKIIYIIWAFSGDIDRYVYPRWLNRI